VGEAEVGRSNAIAARLRETARAFPAHRARLAALPSHVVAEVGGLRVLVVHGDTDSLAGWAFAQEHLRTIPARAVLARRFEDTGVRIIASSHTCLPVTVDAMTGAGRCVLANNGAAGMPNFRGMRCGVITRISTTPCSHARPLYAAAVAGVRVEALAVEYDTKRWAREFLAQWPAESPAHLSYWPRIAQGPAYEPAAAVRFASWEPLS
jgi:hypothetical protein